MTGKELLSGMSLIDEKYIHEAMEVVPAIRKPRYWYKYLAVAACFALIMVAAIPFLSNHPIESPPIEPNSTGSDTQVDNPQNEQPIITIKMADATLNEVNEILDMSRLPADPALYSAVTWNWDEIIEYYNVNLTPAYIPSGLLAAPANNAATVYISKDGTVIDDTVRLQFYHAYYEDGSPKILDDIPQCKGFTIEISKLGILNDFVYSAPENKVETTNINEVEVTFGHLATPYGPYDETTNEPSGYYDKYTSTFTCNGIEYQIITEQLEYEELVKVTASIITGENKIIVDN